MKNQLTSVGGLTCGYDNNGNLTSRQVGTGMYVYYTYDDENQLTSVYTDTSGTPTASRWRNDFTYDGRGRLRKRADYTWYTGGSGSWYPNGETRYVYDGMRVIQERNSANTPTVAYTRGNDLSGSTEGAGGIGGLLARSGYSGGAWGSPNVYHADGNGNVTAMVDSAQASAASYRYKPYGGLMGSSGGMAGANVYRFSSKAWFQSLGLYYYGYRFYDPNLQRWPNRDPIGENGGLNIYAFVDNNPVGEIDPFGLLPPSSPPCQYLKEKIKNIETDIARMARELYLDPQGLPGKLSGDKAKPSISRRGHQMKLNMAKANLAAKKALYQANCSDPEPPSTQPLWKPQPILTGPLTQEQAMTAVVGAAGLIGIAAGAPVVVIGGEVIIFAL